MVHRRRGAGTATRLGRASTSIRDQRGQHGERPRQHGRRRVIEAPVLPRRGRAAMSGNALSANAHIVGAERVPEVPVEDGCGASGTQRLPTRVRVAVSVRVRANAPRRGRSTAVEALLQDARPARRGQRFWCGKIPMCPNEMVPLQIDLAIDDGTVPVRPARQSERLDDPIGNESGGPSGAGDHQASVMRATEPVNS